MTVTLPKRSEVPEEFRNEPVENLATDKQVNYIRSLIDEREVSDESRAAADKRIEEGISKAAASEWIERLLSLPRRRKPKTESRNAPLPDVPAGRYAVDNEDGDLRFYVVDRPTEGRWEGWIFLSVQASDEKHPIKGFAAKREILRKIAVDPAAASRRYGQELGHCGVCGRTLTNEVSREIGIGPICAGKTGWADPVEILRMSEAG